MIRRFEFGEWRPDIQPIVIGDRGLTVATNVLPVAGGYIPMPKTLTITATGIGERPRGALGGVLDAGGYAYNFAGTESGLHMLGPAGITNISKAGGYLVTDTGRWELRQFGDTIIAVAPNHNPQYYTIGTSTLFADLSPNVPQARHCCQLRSFCLLGNVNDTTYGEGQMPNGIWWSATGNPFSWPEPGSDLAASVQSDFRELYGDGGWVQAVASGSEVGFVFQEKAIWRMDYVGGAVIFEITEVERGRGCLIEEIAIPTRRGIFYIAEDGIFMFDGLQSRSIGDGKVNRWFFDSIDMDYLDRVSCAADPDRPLVCVNYSAVGQAGELSNVLVYNWAQDSFSLLENPGIGLDWIMPVRNVSVGTMDDYATSMDASSDSMDTRPDEVGSAILGGIAHVAFKFATFSSSTHLGITLDTGEVELSPGRRSLVLEVRPLVDGAVSTQSIQIGTRNRLMDAVTWGAWSTLDAYGKCPTRSDGRYHRFRFQGFLVDRLAGLDVTFEPCGER